jgi:hypothetical protein
MKRVVNLRVLAGGLFLGLVFSLPAVAGAVVAYDNAVGANSNDSPVTTLSWNHTVTGSNLVGLVGVDGDIAATSGVTWNGAAMTLIGGPVASGNGRVSVYSIVNPSSGPVTVTMASSTTIVAGSISFTGADQTTPTGTFASATPSGTTSSLNVTSAVGEMVFNIVQYANTGILTATGASQTARWTHNANPESGGESTTPGAATVTVSWSTTGVSDNWIIAGVSVKAAAGGCGAVSDPTYVTANAQSSQNIVYWSSGNVLVLEKSGSAVTDVPANGTTYSVGNTIGASIVRFASSGTSVTRTLLTNGTIYYYKVFVYDASHCYSPGIAANATPDTGATDHAQWSYATTATTLAPPGLDPNDVVIAGSNTNTLNGMSAGDGTQAFAPFVTGGAIQAISPVIPAAYSQTGVNIAYVSSQDGFLYAVNTSTGLQVWKSPQLATNTHLQGGAAVLLKAFSGTTVCGVSTDVVFVGTHDTTTTTGNKVYALNGWSSNVTATGSAGGGCVANGIVVAPGAALWTYSPGSMDIISSTPYVDYTNNVVWVTSRAAAGVAQPSLWKLQMSNGTAP